jgi:hypothetical protein
LFYAASKPNLLAAKYDQYKVLTFLLGTPAKFPVMIPKLQSIHSNANMEINGGVQKRVLFS